MSSSETRPMRAEDPYDVGGHQYGPEPLDLSDGRFARLSPGSFGHVALMEATERDVIILENVGPIVMPADAFDRFVSALDEEPGTNPRLESLFSDPDLQDDILHREDS